MAKAISFWFALAAIFVDKLWMIALGVGTVAFVTGPAWHAWIAVILRRSMAERP